MKRLMSVFSSFVLAASVAMAAGTTQLQTVNEGAPEWDFGGDLRIRWVGQNHMADMPSVHQESGGTDYVRFRTRLWGKVTSEELEAYLRVTNEFRYYRSPRSASGSQRFPDETFIDNLYVTFKDVADFIDVKIGRQDISFGERRIIGEGTPMDGSRSCYFDAARLTFKLDSKRTLDALALYMADEDWLPTLGRRHSAHSANAKSYHPTLNGYDQDEYGFALYYQDRSSAAMGWDLYYFFKGETGSEKDPAMCKTVRGAFHSHTFGTRLLPKFSQTVSGELELAVQVGDDNLLAMMAYAGLTYAPGWAWNPQFTVAAYYLSGDRDGTRGRHAWHSLYNRETALGDMVGAMYEGFDHNNLFYPHIGLKLTPSENQFFFMHTGPLFAPVEEKDENGGTYGHFRGYYMQAAHDIAIGRIFAQDSIFEAVKFGVLGEVMAKGNTFDEDHDHFGFYAQVQFTCAF